MSSREVELKLQLVREEDYATLCARLPDFRVERTQRNVYYDTPERLLRDRRILLRVRVEDDRAWLTVKHAPTIERDGLFEVPEDEEPLEFALALHLLAQEQTLDSVSHPVLERLRAEVGDLVALLPWGQLVNHRRRYRISADWIVDVDRTEFPGGVVETEVELEGADPRAGLQLLQPYLRGLETVPQLRPKSERLRAYLDAADPPSS